jgi:hypothetical protein
MKPDERFAELWTDYLEGELDEAGHAELRALLAEHESLRQKAADLYQVHRLLGFAGAASDADSADFVKDTLAHIPLSSEAFVGSIMEGIQCDAESKKVVPFQPLLEPTANQPRIWHRREWLAAAAALTVTAVGGAVWWGRRSSSLPFARVTHNAGGLLTRDQVATSALLTRGGHAVNIQETGPDGPIDVFGGHAVPIEETLPDGPLTLHQGTLGLNYGRGVQVVIEAPAKFQCRDANCLIFHSGRLAAHVPPEAVGFIIETPSGRVIDRGTRFALDTAKESSTQVHVFEGKVDALAHDTPTDSPRRLVTGEALTLAQELKPLQLRDGAFVHPEELPAFVAGLRMGQRQRWLTWRRTVQEDPALVLFAEMDPQHLAHGPVAERMSIAGTRPVQGRWPGKTCLDFNLQGDAVKLDAGGERVWSQLTLAAWVRLDRLGEPYQSLYHTDDWRRGRPGQLHWMITRTAKMRLALQGNVIAGVPPEKPIYADADSSIPVLPERGRWVHLAVVYDAAARTARFFLNGNFDNEVRHDVAHPAQLGSAQIGNWNKQDRKLSGRFDELIILGRALKDEELHAIYAAGNPYA